MIQPVRQLLAGYDDVQPGQVGEIRQAHPAGRDCLALRVLAGIVGIEETPHAPTQTAHDRRPAA